MDIRAYDDILDALKEFNKNNDPNYGNVVVKYPTTNTTYPHTVFTEIRNVANRYYNTRYDKISSIGYRVDIYAKTKGKVDKQDIARNLMKDIDDFLTYYVGLTQISYNVEQQENENSIYHIILTYSANFNENRRKII